MPTLTRILAAATATLALSASPAIAGPPVEISVQLTDQLSSATNASAGSGWSRLTISANHEVDLAILRNKPNIDTGYLANDVGKIPVTKYGKYGIFVARGTVKPGKPYVTTINTLSTRRYTVVVFDDSTLTNGSGNNDTYSAGDWLVPTTPGGGEPPTTTASITLTDKSIKAVGLTSSAPIKVTNAGKRLHELTAYPVKAGAKAEQALELARQGLVKRVKTAGAPTRIMGLVDGKTTQYLEPGLKAGTYLLVSGEGRKRTAGQSHAAQGLAVIATVKP
ncbi:MAG TPA: hypothetical protein VIL49_02390 [Capillimicrobium sp.]|jgi:hypothetical protein